MPGKKPYTPAEKAAMAKRRKLTPTGIKRLEDVLTKPPSQKAQYASGAKNAKGIQTATPEERERVRHRLELKYPKTYPGGGKAPLSKKKKGK